VIATTTRWSSFRSSEKFNSLDNHATEVELVKSPQEWKLVENVLQQNLVPTVNPNKTEFPSTWKPQTIDPKTVPFFISRNKNNMIPVYLKRTHRGLRRITTVKKIDGDIWRLHDELKDHVERSINKEITTRVNEMNGQIQLRGDHVIVVHNYIQQKGF